MSAYMDAWVSDLEVDAAAARSHEDLDKVAVAGLTYTAYLLGQERPRDASRLCVAVNGAVRARRVELWDMDTCRAAVRADRRRAGLTMLSVVSGM